MDWFGGELKYTDPNGMRVGIHALTLHEAQHHLDGLLPHHAVDPMYHPYPTTMQRSLVEPPVQEQLWIKR